MKGILEWLGVLVWNTKAALSEPSRAEEFFEQAAEAAGELDILINNAAICSSDEFHDLKVEDVQTHININALASLIIARVFQGEGEGGRKGE